MSGAEPKIAERLRRRLRMRSSVAERFEWYRACAELHSGGFGPRTRTPDAPVFSWRRSRQDRENPRHKVGAVHLAK